MLKSFYFVALTQNIYSLKNDLLPTNQKRISNQIWNVIYILSVSCWRSEERSCSVCHGGGSIDLAY